jgi:hypothetical protein
MNEIHTKCRYWRPKSDYCGALKVLSPRDKCADCEVYRPHGWGLGDAVEATIDTVTMGQAKKLAKRAKPGGCGCNRRKAALNRVGEAIKDKLSGGA